MRSHKAVYLFALLAQLAGCGDSLVGWPENDGPAPTVSSVTPSDGATGVAGNAAVTAVFNQEMDPSTISVNTFKLFEGATSISGAVTYHGVTAVFTPNDSLAFDAEYTATITTGAKNPAGQALAADYVWSFTTGSVLDTSAPTVLSTIPLDGATNVAIEASLTAVFSEAMSPATLSTASFTLQRGATPVAGSVTLNGDTATFNPADSLELEAEYTATITTQAEDLAGNALAAEYVWTFNTSSAADTTLPTVILTIPEDDEIDVALESNVVAVFSEDMDPATLTIATFVLHRGVVPVSGSVTLDGDTATFNPTAELDPGTEYTATITTGVEDLAGNALALGYVWTFNTSSVPDTTLPTVILTIPEDEEIDVALESNVVAVFSEDMDPATLTIATFVLHRGVVPVSGSVTLDGDTATFNPTAELDPETEYTATITTGAEDLAGNALALDYVWTFTTPDAADTTLPTVILTIPEDEELDVALESNVVAVFSEDMDPATLTIATFVLHRGVLPVSGSVTLDGDTATFNPTADLDPETEYTATITTGAEDLSGNALALDYVWTFTTEDTMLPTVILTIPEDEEIDVLVDSNVVATFSEEMDPATLSTATFVLELGAVPVPGSVTLDGATATFDPTDDLDPETEYTATITTGAADLAGNALALDYVWTFTTEDTTPPTIIETIPMDGAEDVALDANVFATFSEEMDLLVITDLTFTVMNGLIPVEGVGTIDGNTVMFDPDVDLEPNTEYTALVSPEVTDLSGNALVAGLVPNPWTFTTEAGPGPIIGVNLGLATPFAIAATAGVTNTITAPLTHINGDVVLDPLAQCNAVPVDGAGGFGVCGGMAPTINGTVITDTYPDTTTSGAVKADLNAAFLFITPPAGPPAVGSLGGGIPLPAPTTLGDVTGAALVLGDNWFTPGVYTSITSILITGDILLDGQGDSNAVFIFQSASTLTTADGAPLTHTRILLTGGANAANVWWQVGSSATIGLYSEFQGNILAAYDITMKTAATSCGRSMAGAWVGGAGAFIFDSNVVSVPGSCP